MQTFQKEITKPYLTGIYRRYRIKTKFGYALCSSWSHLVEIHKTYSQG
jgi:hypothetical protein